MEQYGSTSVFAPSLTTQRDVRNRNLATVLAAISRSAPVSQGLLVQSTGLKKPTVASLVTQLSALGWISIVGGMPSNGGRPSRLFAPSPDRGFLLAMRAGVEGVSALVVDSALVERMMTSRKADVRDLSADESAELLANLAADCLRELPPNSRVLGASLALPGIVGQDRRLRYAPGLRWRDVDFEELLRIRLGDLLPAEIPMHIANEANLATLGERRWGDKMGDDFVCVLGEEGVGGGVLIGGKLLSGRWGAGGEIGHITVDVNGPLCSCGKRGCWAVFISEDALVRSVNKRIEAGDDTVLSAGTVTSTSVVDAADAGDRIAEEELANLRHYLVAGIANLATAYDPTAIVIGGFLRYAFRNRLDEVLKDLDSWAMRDRVYQGLELQLSHFARDGSLWGGVSAIYEDITSSSNIHIE